ncbi:MAG: hypothetical protein IH594_01385, partial [Bacteroidales bacterium]|nr:hypothetical protein [Bacteroidales bacterium]
MKKSKALSLRAAFVAVFMISIFSLSINAQPTRNWGQLQIDNYGTIRNDFNDPDMIYAPFLYWFWDEPLDREKIRNMTQEILKQKFNIGYIFAHTSMADLLATTPGLEKAMDPHPSLPDEEWLSQEWFDAIRDVVEITKESNAYVTYADEYMWPSGRANGRVIKQHPELHNSNLDFSVKDVRGGESVVLPGSFFTIAAKIEKPKDAGEYLYSYSNETISLSGLTAEDVSSRKSIGQTILVEKPWLKKVSLKTTSFFLETKTGFTLEARLNNPEGKLISRIYYGPGIHEYDNPGLEIHDVLPAGTTLYIGMIPDDGFTTREFAWWGKKGDPYPGGSSYLDGEKQADEVDRYLRLYYKLTRNTRDSIFSMDEAMDPYFETEIKSSTLTFIGEGDEFTWRAPKGGSWRVYSFNRQDGNSVNYLDKRLASAFIEIAHKPYFENLGKYMDNVIPGAICDTEGSYGSLPWSAHLPEYYKEMTGQDIRLMMPLLIDKDIEGVFARARFDFMESVSDLYSSYFGEVNDYLEKHGLYYVSNLWEESLQWIASNVGDLMKTQRRFSLPGTDALTLKIYDPHDLAESHSVAAFEGRRLECEFMGAGGWGDLTMQNLKAGIN